MPQPVNQWRADKGLTCPPTPPPPPSPPPPPPQPPATIMFHAPPHPFYYIAPGPTCAYLNGPMGINGLFTPPPSYQILASTPTPIQKPAPPAPKAPKKKIALPPLPPPPPPPPPEPQKKSEIAIKKTSNFYAPPSIPPGTNYWFPAERTQLHIFNKGVKIWEERWKGDKKYVFPSPPPPLLYLTESTASFFPQAVLPTYLPTYLPSFPILLTRSGGKSFQILLRGRQLARQSHHRTHAGSDDRGARRCARGGLGGDGGD